MVSTCDSAGVPDTVRETVALLLVDSRCELGECPLWCEREQALWWIDIESSRLWRFRSGDGSVRQWRLPDRAGSFALCESGRLLLGLAKGLYMAELAGDEIGVTPLVEVDADQPTLRINDGRTDRAGNFVFGTLNEDPQRARIGSFYQYSNRHGLRRLDLGGVAIPNSLCFSPDGQRLYYCDSLDRRILRCRYDAEQATVGSPEVFAELGPNASPDGAVVDRDGKLWSAQWGASRVVGYDHNGKVEHVVGVPVSHVTCPVFAGKDYGEMFIASARVELSPEVLQAEICAGGIFKAQVPAKGLPESRFDDL
ncbi:MAG: SMP-30/gluconolactonase/LRE family protein [Pseudoxanthomonas sp.]